MLFFFSSTVRYLTLGEGLDWGATTGCGVDEGWDWIWRQISPAIFYLTMEVDSRHSALILYLKWG